MMIKRKYSCTKNDSLGVVVNSEDVRFRPSYSGRPVESDVEMK